MIAVIRCSKCGNILGREYDWIKDYSIARSIICDICLNGTRIEARMYRISRSIHPTFDEAVKLNKLNKEVKQT